MNTRTASQDITLRVVCPICAALYVPAALSPVDQLLATPENMAASLLSISSFCYRCRRPACPCCWVEPLQLCAACVCETDPRYMLPPIPDVSMPFASVPLSLFCVEAGRFVELHFDESMPIEQSEEEERISTLPYTTVELRQAIQRAKRKEPDALEEQTTVVVRRRHSYRFFWLFFIGVFAVIIGLIVASLLRVEVNSFVNHVLHMNVRELIAALWLWVIQYFR
ncbi:hypothetical protein EI42_01396 [Thermosporothrix hazakensis]|jgi:hypothetical protein|uniref:Uncharacterized protein n=1 Tax=Thermosporothrix hazakensis TaxID=644383 RepID=A0A326UKA8_THEHA|nr:hypothetical protein [Thermosporothrix hazakensis]PZW32853.1 hypothetical protein EI42_01396 [Thermosporothrix hazakensis]GCE48884.1 hypothetical protein KTH_37530 [Thermosporothrix hazakensis]